MLDDRDLALLAELERDARASVVALARAIGLSRSATQDRLARLERTGAIARYTIERGADVVPGGLVALLMIRHDSPGGCERLAQAIRVFPGVMMIEALAGDPDMVVRVTAADTAALDEVAGRVRALPGVRDLSTHVVLGSRR